MNGAQTPTSCISTFSAGILLPTSKAYAGCLSCRCKKTGFQTAAHHGVWNTAVSWHAQPWHCHAKFARCTGLDIPACIIAAHPAIEVAGIVQVAALPGCAVDVGGRPRELVTVASEAALGGIQALQSGQQVNSAIPKCTPKYILLPMNSKTRGMIGRYQAGSVACPLQQQNR